LPRQPVLLTREDRKIVPAKVEVFGEWLYDQPGVKAWFTLRRYFARIKSVSLQSTLCLDDRYSLPLNPYAKYSVEELAKATEINEKCDQAFNLTAGLARAQESQNVTSWTISLLASAVVIVFVVAAIMLMSRGGP